MYHLFIHFRGRFVCTFWRNYAWNSIGNRKVSPPLETGKIEEICRIWQGAPFAVRERKGTIDRFHMYVRVCVRVRVCVFVCGMEGWCGANSDARLWMFPREMRTSKITVQFIVLNQTFLFAILYLQLPI